MRFAIVSERHHGEVSGEVGGGKRRCALRVPAVDPGGRAERHRVVENDPADAAKPRVTRPHDSAAEPAHAAKGERGNSGTGAIQC